MKGQIAIGAAVLEEDTRWLVGPHDKRRLTPQRAALLVALHAAKGRTVTREQLLSAIWDGRGREPAFKLVDILVCHVRRALEYVGAGDAIETNHGAGYRMREGVAAPSPVLLDSRRAGLLIDVLKVAARVEPALVQEFLRA